MNEYNEINDIKDLNKKSSPIWIVYVLLAAVILAIIIYQFIFFSMTVSQSSMSPTLYGGNGADKGDTVLLWRTSKIERHDIVVIDIPNEEPIIKRVIAIEGDTVIIKQGNVFINGVLQKEEYILKQNSTYAENENKWVVGKGEFFVLGDNRIVSRDSRYYGKFKLNAVRGEVFGIISAKTGKTTFI